MYRWMYSYMCFYAVQTASWGIALVLQVAIVTRWEIHYLPKHIFSIQASKADEGTPANYQEYSDYCVGSPCAQPWHFVKVTSKTTRKITNVLAQNTKHSQFNDTVKLERKALKENNTKKHNNWSQRYVKHVTKLALS